MFKKFPTTLPFPDHIPEKVKKLIIKGLGKLLDVILDNDKDIIGNKPKLDEKNILSVCDYNKELNSFLNQLESDMNIVEEKIIEESMVYYDELILLLKSVEESKNIDLNTKYIVKNINRNKKNIKGSLMKNFYSRFSLDNPDLKSILCLREDEIKHNKIKKFKLKEIQKGIELFISEVKFMLQDINEDITDKLQERIDYISSSNCKLMEQLKILEEPNNTKEVEAVLENTKKKIELCNAIICIIGE